MPLDRNLKASCVSKGVTSTLGQGTRRWDPPLARGEHRASSQRINSLQTAVGDFTQTKPVYPGKRNKRYNTPVFWYAYSYTILSYLDSFLIFICQSAFHRSNEALKSLSILLTSLSTSQPTVYCSLIKNCFSFKCGTGYIPPNAIILVFDSKFVLVSGTILVYFLQSRLLNNAVGGSDCTGSINGWLMSSKF